MKKIGNVLKGIVISVWLVMAIFVIIFLLSYNDFKVSTFGKYSLIIMDSDEMEPEYLEGDLLVVKRNSDAKINVGDSVFYYNTSKDSDTTVYADTIQAKKEVNRSQATYTLNDKKVSSDYIIGTKQSTKTYHHLGTILNILTSKWGYMFLVIFPTLFAVIYEIVLLVETAKKNKNTPKNTNNVEVL